MKLLYFTYDFPVPITSGGKNRAFHMLKYGKGDIDTILFSFYREVPDSESIEIIESLGISTIRLFKRPLANFKSIAQNPLSLVQNTPAIAKIANPLESITKKLYFNPSIQKELIKTVEQENIDVVHFESLYTAYYFSPLLTSMGVKQIFGTENIESKLYEEYAKTSTKKIFKPIYLLEAKKIKKDEHLLFQSFDNTIAVSKEDADTITRITNSPCHIVENGVDIHTFSFKKKKSVLQNGKAVLLFVGNFTYFPNITAIKNFYTQVFQHLGDEYELRIIGKDVESLNITGPQVTCIPFVKDIRDEYYRADAFVFPIRIGGGTNFKIVEAMACGLPIIGYGDRLTSMGIEHKKQAVIVQNGTEFVKEIKKLIDNVDGQELMARRARLFVEERYSWEVIGEKLHRYWKSMGK